jgi:hypothetical protein
MDTIPGMEIRTDERIRHIAFQDGVPIGAFVSLLALLMQRGLEFAFYDPDYPSMSDPGAHFSYSPRNGKWRMTLGNHGWSGGIYEIDPSVLAGQLHDLYSKGLMKSLELERVAFFAHYQPESASNNKAMNKELRKLHSPPDTRS